MSENTPNTQEKLPPLAYVVSGWPLLLVLIGGAIGGALGGAAFGVNLAIYKSRLPLAAKIALNLATGLAAAALWLTIAMAIVRSRT
jgi:hypothetical protein